MPKSIFSKAIYRTSFPEWLMYVFINLWAEFWLRLGTTTKDLPFWKSGIYFTLVVTICGASLYYLLCSFFNRKIRTVLLSFGVCLSTLICMVQMVYFHIFGTYFIIFSIKTLGKAVDTFTDVMFASIWSVIIFLILMLLPVALWFWKSIRRVQKVRATYGQRVIIGLIVLVNYILLLFGLLVCGHKDLSPHYLYWNNFEVTPCVRTFGAVNTLRLDLKYQVFGTKNSSVSKKGPNDLDGADKGKDGKEETSKEPVKYNTMNIDFDAAISNTSSSEIQDLHEYFKEVTPTKQNQYTGMFKGKNVILITAEGFSTCAMDPVRTPTLYKMAHEGLDFTNYYSPGWGVSTLDGEYVNLVGLIPKSNVWSMWRAKDNDLHFTVGNVTKRLGYLNLAYHNNSYDYYSRNESHYNLGYDWIAIGNGLELEHSVWPNSDEEMIAATTGDYLTSDKPFSVYYLTVSGHANYNFPGNMMATWNKDIVENLEGYSEEAKAYLACQYELEKAMTLLLQRLTEAGKLDDTLIVMAADHYPYGLSMEAQKEFYGQNFDENFDEYHNTLIVYNPKFKHTVIEKPCYSIDILPTVLNLMGAEYDSRLLMGTDILSDSSGLIIFNNRSWITEKGRYNSQTEKFEPNPGVTVSDDYIDTVCSIVSKKFSVSTMMLDDDYYGKLFS